MTYTFAVTVKELEGFENPLFTATISKDGDQELNMAWLNKQFSPTDVNIISRTLHEIIDEVFPVKKEEVKKPSSSTRSKTK